MIIRSLAIATFSFVCVLAAPHATAQILHARGQNVVPVYEGWERNPDGTFTMVFGYFNRNLEEQPYVPVGPDNAFEPGDPDRGQPTHFYPRRQQFMFRIQVPRDWGNKELIWTLTSNGKTEKAYGTLLPIWEIGPLVYEQNRSTTLLHHKDEPINQAPSIKLLSAPQATLTLPETLSVTVSVADDELPVPPPPRRRRSGDANVEARVPDSPMTQAVVRLDPGWRLGVIWVHHRGPGTVTFDPMRQPIDGKAGQAVARASFSEPGSYVLRAYADDGVLMNYVDVTVVIKAGATGAPQR
jgi:hypothetical protein